MASVPISKDIIPYYFDIALGSEVYTITVEYNSLGFFTLGLSKNGIALCDGEPVTYGVPLWKDFRGHDGFPQIKITPLDESQEYNAVTFDNLDNTVLLTVGDWDEQATNF